MKEFFKHLKIIRTHRKYVRKACFKMGLFWQGLTHDLSKYSITEIKICKYYTGKKSPHQVAREQLGYSPSWIHHYHTNKHHFQFFIDEDEDGKFIPIKMPYRFLLESLADMIGASKAYNPNNWAPELLLNYWENHCKGKRLQHKESEAFLDNMIMNLVVLGNEEDFFKWFNNNKKVIKKTYEEGWIWEQPNKF